MSPPTKLNCMDTTTLEDDFFDIVKNSPGHHTHHINQPPPENEEKLLKDGTAQVLRACEARKKRSDYSRSQTSRGTKQAAISMSFVDWSGFPGAAHSPANPAERKKRTTTRRSSLNNNTVDPAKDNNSEQRRAILRMAQRRLSADSLDMEGSVTMDSEIMASPKQPREMRKHIKSRRHIIKTTPAVPAPTVEGGTPSPNSPSRIRSSRRASLDLQGGSQHRQNNGVRGNSGSHRPQRNRSSCNNKNTNNSSSERNRSQRSVRPLSNAQSMSPSARRRRPVVAAASSTTFERRKTPQRTQSAGKRHTTRRTMKIDDEDGILHKASSIRW